MKLTLLVTILCISLSSHAQSLEWEILETHDPIAEFHPTALAVAPSGTFYVTGKYQHGTEYYKSVDGVTVIADSTMPNIGLFGSMFVYKFTSDGKLANRSFAGGLASEYRKLKPEDFRKDHLMLPSVVEGNTIQVTSTGKLFITGFANGYREKNYETDRAQGIFAMMLDTNFMLKWDKMYPSFYNSTPQKAIENEDGQFIILGTSLIKTVDVSKYLSENTVSPRILKVSAKGKLLADTLLQDLPSREDLYWDDTDKHTYLAGEATSFVEMPTGYLFSGTIKERSIGSSVSRYAALLMETDKDFKPLRKKTYTLFREQYSQYEFIGGNIAVSKKAIALTGVAQIGHPPCFTALIDRETFDTIAVVRMDGDVFSYPGIAKVGTGKYAVALKDHHEKAMQLHFIENNTITKTITLKKYPIIDYVDMQRQGDYLYILGYADKGCYIAKVRL